ncbi:hypothetical protein SAMN02982919_02037 [Giesbergeria anulus]|uniref:Uncharacterized protein n=1 Tax=Giesbergeria anulus TaxID=180197 RepID=A0A1H9MTF0_9BURK|nr:hypothetical protein SAMN02982919_02037 [Giesbergeria anulus]
MDFFARMVLLAVAVVPPLFFVLERLLVLPIACELAGLGVRLRRFTVLGQRHNCP